MSIDSSHASSLPTLLPADPDSCSHIGVASRSDHFNPVTVTLTVREPRPNFVLPQRQITLTEQTPAVRVGRASKVASKGFVAGTDNAWFESPVMSREHAELTANFQTKVSTTRSHLASFSTFLSLHVLMPAS